MKRTLYIGLLFLCLLASCNHNAETRQGTSPPAAYPELSAVDSLLWQQPDSALTRLIPYFDTCRDVSRNVSATYNRHYAHLLLAELLYKNYYEQTNRAELQQAVGYFDSLCPCADVAFLDARAHYINGVGYYERDSVVEACKEYLTALEVMETHFDEKELTGKKAQFMALANTRLTDLFSESYLHEQAIYFAKESLAFYNSVEGPSWQKARMLCEVGSHYEILEQIDSADNYYQNAMAVLDDTNSLIYRDILALQSGTSYKKSNDSGKALSELHYLLDHADSEAECMSRCLSIAAIFYKQQQYDSAWLYLKKVYDETGSIASKRQAAEWLVGICKIKGKKDDILEYADFLVPFANQEENKSEVKSQMTEFYKTFAQTKADRQHQNEIRQFVKQTSAIIGGLLVVLLAIVVISYKNRQKKTTA